jgi:hypothetical protein
MARDWGFMGESIAGSDLSPSAVHALLEIEEGNVNAKDLAAMLRLEKSSVSRMLHKLVEAGDIRSHRPPRQPAKAAVADPCGQVARRIHSCTCSRTGHACPGTIEPGTEAHRLKGQLYSAALSSRIQGDKEKPVVELVSGYQPGIIARITQMHAQYYSRETGLGQRFESVLPRAWPSSQIA